MTTVVNPETAPAGERGMGRCTPGMVWQSPKAGREQQQDQCHHSGVSKWERGDEIRELGVRLCRALKLS